MNSSNDSIDQLVEELKIIEHSMNQLLMQKQAFEIDLSETSSAITEVEKTDGEVYKVIGSVMIKSEKSKLITDLNERKKLVEKRIEAIERQEALIESKAKELKSSFDEKTKNSR